MTFMDRQHNLTIRFVSIVSVMNIHGWRIVRFVNTLDDLYQAGVLENEEYIAWSAQTTRVFLVLEALRKVHI